MTPSHISQQAREAGIVPWHTKFTHLVVVFVTHDRERKDSTPCYWIGANILARLKTT